jgi:hypothetical protein
VVAACSGRIVANESSDDLHSALARATTALHVGREWVLGWRRGGEVRRDRGSGSPFIGLRGEEESAWRWNGGARWPAAIKAQGASVGAVSEGLEAVVGCMLH